MFISDDDDDEFKGVLRYMISIGGVQFNLFYLSRISIDIVDLVCGNDINKLVDFLNLRNLIRDFGDELDEDQ